MPYPKKFIPAYAIIFMMAAASARPSFAQLPQPYGDKINWLSGYEKTITGETITYFSAFPDYIDQALLTRATDGRKVIEWLTAPVPLKNESKYLYFRWVAGHSTGTSSGARHFDFFINDEKALTITTLPGNKNPEWSFAAGDSTKIVFIRLKTDAANDAHGLAYLRVPVARVKPGQPLRLKLVGEAQHSNDWFMTFKYAFEEKADITALPFLLKNGKQPLSLNVLHFGKKEKLAVTVNNKEKSSFSINDGMNSFDIQVTAVKQKDSVLALVKLGDRILFNRYVPIEPVIKREIDFIHNSHTDIGYSYLQPEVARIQTKNIYDALRMIEKTKNYPPEARFKWNVESLWAAENFLDSAAPADKKRFFAAVKNGSICLSGFYANILTALSMPEEMFHYTDYAAMLREKYGLPIESAMISDIPGLTWATVDAFAKGGIKYLSDGPNYLGPNSPYLGDRVGNFIKAWGDKPVWWESPSGKDRILLWTAGKGYSSWHGTAPGAVFYRGQKKIAQYMNELASHHYPYEMVQWRYNIVADNGPVDTTISDFVKQWNEKYASPKIVLNTVDKMCETFEKRYGNKLPVVKGDMTPYWEDGAASTAFEEGQNRVYSLRLQQLTTLYAMLSPRQYSNDAFYQASKNILLFSEHTWGAYNSISQPDLPFVTEQWKLKKNYFLQAKQQINRLEHELLQPLTDSSSKRIAVINTLSWSRGGLVYLPSNIKGNAVTDENNKSFPLQSLSDGKKVFMAKNLPPLSVSYFIIKNDVLPTREKSPFIVTDSSVSNGKIFVAWNKANGSITALKKDGFNFSGNYGGEGLNAYWYVPGRNPGDAVTSGKIKASVENNGPCLITVNMQSTAPGANDLTWKISLLVNDDEVQIEDVIDKKAIRSKEGVYFAFPFSSGLLNTTFDAGYGTMRYLKDQLPGSNMDFIGARRWLDASDNRKGIQLMMIEPFMVAPDSMVDEDLVINQSYKKWRDEGKPTATWFSYIMNNYWHTNYKADQDGISEYHYALRPHGILQNDEQEKAAMEFTQPLLAFPVKDKVILPPSIFELTNNKIIVTSITPQANGSFKLRVFNPGGVTQTFRFEWKGLKPKALTIAGSGKNTGINSPLHIPGYEVMDLIVK